jgi:flagellar biogenesis protein FliO
VDLVVLILVIALIGFLIYLITSRIPMPPGWAAAIQVLALVVIVLYLITRFFNLPNVLPR